jgi:hypothetical protein
MARSGKVTMTGLDKLETAIQDHDRKVKKVVLGQFLRAEGEAVAYAKQNAPWTDRTGNARAGLFAKTNVLDGANSFELVVAHSVHYGIWLEVRFSGKYAIIQPTVDYIGQVLISRIGSSLSRIGAGV